MSPNAQSSILIRRTIKALIDAGYTVRLFDGEAWVVGWTTDVTRLMANCSHTDETSLQCRPLGDYAAQGESNPSADGFIDFHLSNGWEALSDYTENLAHIMGPIADYAESYQ
jgi:hypothetical protein